MPEAIVSGESITRGEGSVRIAMPTVYRGNYLSALKALSRTRRPEPLIRGLDHAQRWTAAVEWRSVAGTRRELEACYAFLDSDAGEAEGRMLRMPGGG